MDEIQLTNFADLLYLDSLQQDLNFFKTFVDDKKKNDVYSLDSDALDILNYTYKLQENLNKASTEIEYKKKRQTILTSHNRGRLKKRLVHRTWKDNEDNVVAKGDIWINVKDPLIDL